MIKKCLSLFCLLLTVNLAAKANFNFNKNCIDAYNAILSLRIAEAKQLIQREKQQNPSNAITVLLDNYVDYFTLLATDNRADYNRFKDTKSDRVSALGENESNSPYYLFSQAEVYMQVGLIKGKFGDYFSSSTDLKKANNLLKENARKFPDFLPNQKDLGLINVVFGALPSNLKSMAALIGMKGNVQTGIKQLEELRSALPKTKYSFYKDEVIFFLCQMDIDVLHNKNNYAKLISFISGMESNSLLKVYLQGYVAAKTAHNEEAIDFLEARPTSGQYISLPAINYLLGVAKLNRMDTDTPVFLLKYVKDYKGANYIKDSYLKLAYYHYLKNEPDKYEYYVKLAKTRGYAIDEKDKQALKEANDTKPDVDLLKARFYFDGGYYSKGLMQLKNKDASDFKLQRDKIEYHYRLGRLLEKTDRLNDAIGSYQKAIALGKETRYYFAANAALSIGQIFEHNKEFKKAAYYYNQAIGMKDHEYKNSIDNEANDGLKRMNM
jgi:hypothetical protein